MAEAVILPEALLVIPVRIHTYPLFTVSKLIPLRCEYHYQLLFSGPPTSVTAFTRGNKNFHGYVENNFYDSDQDGTLNGSDLGDDADNYGGMELVDSKYDYPAVESLLTPEEAATYVTSSTYFDPFTDHYLFH